MGKLVDTNLFLGSCPIRVLRHEADPRSILLAAEAVTGIFTCFSALFHKDWCAGLRRDAALAKGARKIFFHGVTNPSTPGWREDFLRLRSEFPVVSLKVFPDLHGYALPQLQEVAEFARDQNLPMVIMRRLVDDRLLPVWWKPRPMELAIMINLLRTLDAPRLVFSNFLPYEIDALISASDGCRDWYYEVGTFTPTSFWYSSLGKARVISQLMLGSGSPLYYPAGAMSIENAGLSAEESNRILSLNAQGVYGV